MSILLARLRPRNPRLGLKVKDYSLRYNSPGSAYHLQWFDFRQAGVWYRVPAEVGEVLRRTAQDPYRPSPLIFDVCTEAEALELDRQARLERERRQAQEEPSVATAVDLTGGLASQAPAPPPVVAQVAQVAQELPLVQEPSVGRGDMVAEDVARSRAAALQATRPPEPERKPEPKPKPKHKPKPKPKHKPRPEPVPVLVSEPEEPSLDWTRVHLVARAMELGIEVKKDWTKPVILQLIQDKTG